MPVPTTNYGQKLSLKAYWGVITPLNVLAISLTVFRLCQRSSARKLWGDDYMAFVSLLCAIGYMSTPYFRDDDNLPMPLTADQLHRRIVTWWLSTILFPLVVWTARMSIGLSIVRLVPSRTRCHYFLVAMNMSFLGAVLALVLDRVRRCAPITSWHHNRAVHCYSGLTYAYVTLAADLTSDTFLVLVPFMMLRNTTLPPRLRRLIMAIFASSILSSIAGIVSAIFLVKARRTPLTWGWVVQFTSNIKAAVTLSVCNLLVVVTFIYRRVRTDEAKDDDVPVSDSESDIEISKLDSRQRPGTPPAQARSHDPKACPDDTPIQTGNPKGMSTIGVPRTQ